MRTNFNLIIKLNYIFYFILLTFLKISNRNLKKKSHRAIHISTEDINLDNYRLNSQYKQIDINMNININ